MSTHALAKIDTDNRTQGELIQLVSFMLADEEYGVEVLKSARDYSHAGYNQDAQYTPVC